MVHGSAEDRESAWRYSRWKYGINTGSLRGISYNSNQRENGLTNIYTKNCNLGPGAFDSENLCASTLGHENVHGGQPSWYLFLSTYTWRLGGRDFAEVEAYNWEISNANKTGLSPAELNDVIAWRNYYNRKGPKPQ